LGYVQKWKKDTQGKDNGKKDEWQAQQGYGMD
jgi:hypothetical protein